MSVWVSVWVLVMALLSGEWGTRVTRWRLGPRTPLRLHADGAGGRSGTGSATLFVVLAGVFGVRGESGVDLFDVGAVDADGLVEGLPGDAEVLAPIVDIGGDFGVDLGGAAGAVLYVC